MNEPLINMWAKSVDYIRSTHGVNLDDVFFCTTSLFVKFCESENISVSEAISAVVNMYGDKTTTNRLTKDEQEELLKRVTGILYKNSSSISLSNRSVPLNIVYEGDDESENSKKT